MRRVDGAAPGPEPLWSTWFTGEWETTPVRWGAKTCPSFDTVA